MNTKQGKKLYLCRMLTYSEILDNQLRGIIYPDAFLDITVYQIGIDVYRIAQLPISDKLQELIELDFLIRSATILN